MKKQHILEEYCDTQTEIGKLEKTIERIKKQSPMVSDSVQNGYKHRAIIYGVDIQRKYKLEKLENKIKMFRDKLLEQQSEVINFIETIPKSKTRQIFWHYYIDGMDWYQVAIQMGYSGESTPRTRHDRYLEKIL